MGFHFVKSYGLHMLRTYRVFSCACQRHKKLDTSLKLSPDELDCSVLTKATKKKSTSIAIQSYKAIME